VKSWRLACSHAGDAWCRRSRHTCADASRGPTRIGPLAKQSLMGDEPAPAPFVSIGESVLADDQQCDNKHPNPNRIAQLIAARGSLQNDVQEKFEVASRLPQACDFSSRLSETLKGYAARLCLTTCSRERCFSFIGAVETTPRPRSASCTSSRWIACRRSCLRP
jgi:hypothetical protein